MPSLLPNNPDKSHPTMSSKNKDDQGALGSHVAATITIHSSTDSPTSLLLGGDSVTIVYNVTRPPPPLRPVQGRP